LKTMKENLKNRLKNYFRKMTWILILIYNGRSYFDPY
jgi:hypothetical protein